MEIINKNISDLKPYENNPRNNDEAVDVVAASIKEFGFKVPIIIDNDNVIVCGHTRYKAAKKLKLENVPCIIADDLTDAQIKAFRLADNKVSEKATWNEDLKFLELSEIEPLGIDMLQFGFEELEKQLDEIDFDDLDDNSEKKNVIVSINCGELFNYEEIKERLQNLADEIHASISVKMQ